VRFPQQPGAAPVSLWPLTPWPGNEVAPTRLPLCKPSARGLKERDGRLVKSFCLSWRTVKAFRAPRARVKSPLFAILLATGWLYARIDRCQVVRSRKRPG